ncbi:MAG: hypothetical protein RL033_5311, partial [Pseudomonadota bacterium]
MLPPQASNTAWMYSHWMRSRLGQ